jgi:hypothetical protein
MTLILPRISSTSYGTFGALIDTFNYFPFATTIERPWLDNKPNVSCIPAGTYTCKRVTRPKHGECFEVQNVEGRSAILFHVANYPEDVQGCIGVASGFNSSGIGEHPAMVTGSRNGMRIFMNKTKNIHEFKLIIVNQ